MASDLTIYILCRDRIPYLREMLSRLQVLAHPLVISDNSVDEAAAATIHSLAEAGGFGYLRQPNLPVLLHIKTLMAECPSDYFCLLHDDDVVDPAYFDAALAILRGDLGCVAVASYPQFIDGDSAPRPSPVCSTWGLDSPEELYRRYLNHEPIAVFPSYVYRTSSVKPALSAWDDLCGFGKHSDLLFLTLLIKQGRFHWIGTENRYFRYRQHAGQDSAKLCAGERIRLSDYARHRWPGLRRQTAFFRAVNICAWLEQRQSLLRFSPRVCSRALGHRHLARLNTLLICHRIKAKIVALFRRFKYSQQPHIQGTKNFI